MEFLKAELSVCETYWREQTEIRFNVESTAERSVWTIAYSNWGKKSDTSLKWIWNPPRSDDFFAPSYLAPELQTPDTFQTRHAALCNSSCGFGAGPNKISFLDPGSEWRGAAPGLLFLNLLVRRDRDQSRFHMQQLHPDDVPRMQRRPMEALHLYIYIFFLIVPP